MRFRLWSALLHGTSSRAADGRRTAFEPPPGIRVLVVEDESAAVEFVVRSLTDAGCDVAREHSGEGGFFRATTERFDVILLALTLPGRSGLEVLAALRDQAVTTPVLIMAGHGSVEDRVVAFDAGADDYVVQPVALPELVARVRALARRGASDPVCLCTGDMVLDPMARTARRGGRALQLTSREFQLLEYLVRHRGEVVSRERLTRDVWRSPELVAPLDNVIDVHMARLRKKVDGNAAVRLIHTIRGVGFVFGEEHRG